MAARKFDDLTDSEKSSLREATAGKAAVLKMDPYDKERDGGVLLDGYGLCCNCSYMEYARSEFRVHKAFCAQLEIRLHTGVPIVECSKYSKRGEMLLSDMWAIATLIDVPGDKIGF